MRVRSGRRGIGLATLALAASAAAWGQQWDWGARAATALSEASGGKLKLSFEQRGRYEERSGNTFGKDVDVDTGLIRTRLGLSYTPVQWLKFSAMAQDCRAPWYGTGAPNNMRDQADLHEAYFELFPSYKKGFGMTAGRMMLNYGEGRLIGTPQWGNLSRTYDHVRVYWRTARVRYEAFVVSPVKVITGQFNKPVPGDRMWGMYNTFPNLFGENQLEYYFLRREQNRPGGYTGGSSKNGTDKLGINTIGFHLTGPLASGVKYSLEAALQKGLVGPANLSSSAWAGWLSRRWNVARKKTLDAMVEYKYASGTANPADATHTGTFDQLYAANHDRFGHQDLFGWRNIHNARALGTLGMTKNFAINVQYLNYWLANLKDGVYNGTGKLIARSATGTAGRHIGQEADIFGTYKYNHFTFGAGYAHFFAGEFVRNATPGVGPAYVYVFHQYSL